MQQIPHVTEITRATKGLSLPSFAYSPPNFTDEECIDCIRYLPDYVMQNEHGIFLEATDLEEEELINPLKKNYRYLADWLEYYVLKDTSKLAFLNKTERKIYKPNAELSMAILRLIQEVCAFVDWLDSKKISINRWWLACEWEMCDDLLKHSGYLDSPLLIGSSDYYKQFQHQDKEWGNQQTQTTDIGIYEATPMQALEGLAYLISQHRDNILFRTHFDHYRKIKKRVANALRKSKLNPAYLNNGQFHLMQQGKPGQKRIMK